MTQTTSTNDGILTRYIIDAVGLCCALGYVVLVFLARQDGEPELLSYYGVLVWTATPVFCLYLYLVRKDESFPLGRLLFWAIVFRLCGLLGGPFYEDDFYRYLWDGYRFWVAGTPYGVAPEAFFLDASVPIALKGVLDQINHPDISTIYGPLTQLLFLVAFLIQAASITVLQSLLILVDLATIYLLTRLTTTRNVMLYAWCPLVVKEIAFTAHPDGLGICLVLASIVLITNNRNRTAAVFLGLAVGAKLFALALVPFVLKRAKVQHWIYFAGTLVLLYTPFVLFGSTELDSLLVFMREWEFNSSLYGLLSMVIPATPLKILLAGSFGLFLSWYWITYRRDSKTIPRGDWIYGVFFITAPVFNAWYMLWILPFAAIYPSRWAWTASVALLLTYVTGLTLHDYEMQAYAQPSWVRVVEFGAITIALLRDIHRHHQEDLNSGD